MKDKELKLEEIEASHTRGGAGLTLRENKFFFPAGIILQKGRRKDNGMWD